MQFDWNQVLWLILGSSLTSSIVATLLSYYLSWNNEKKRIKLNRRIELLRETRSYLDSTDFRFYLFIESGQYQRISPYLSQKLKEYLKMIHEADQQDYEEMIQSATNFIGDEANAKFSYLIKMRIENDLIRLERKWVLNNWWSFIR